MSLPSHSIAPSRPIRSLRWGAIGRHLVPLAEPRILGWFVRDVLAPHGRRQRLARALLARRPTAALAPLLFSSPPPATALQAARRLVAECGVAPAALEQAVVVSDYAGAGRGRTTLFLFAPHASTPQAVVKVRALDSGGRPLRREHDLLRQLRAEVPAELKGSLPEPRSLRQTARHEIFELEFLPGRSADAALHSSARPAHLAARHLRAALDWLAALQRATAAGTVPPPEPAVSEPGGAGGWFEDLRRRWRERPLPAVAGHGDFWGRNILLHGGRTSGVVDWERGGERVAPHLDVFDFLFAMAHSLAARRGREEPQEPLRFLLDEPALGPETRAALGRYCAAMDLDAALLDPLARLYVRQRRRAAEASGAADASRWRQWEATLDRRGSCAFFG